MVMIEAVFLLTERARPDNYAQPYTDWVTRSNNIKPTESKANCILTRIPAQATSGLVTMRPLGTGQQPLCALQYPGLTFPEERGLFA